jgi:spore photoproduct lyase
LRTIDTVKAIIHFRQDRDNPVVRRFLDLGNKEIIECRDDHELESAVESLKHRGISSKEAVILKKFRGRIFQKCPGSPGVICCNYLLLNIGFNCLYNCTYCYLNYYLNSYGLIQFINTETSFQDIWDTVRENRDMAYRIGTGEYTDSLIFDDVTGIGTSLITGSARYRNLFIELKTKSDNIRHLLDIREKGNAVLAWSLNTTRNIDLYEAGAASLEERLDSAAAACGAGYLIAFHFDPIITRDGNVEEYLEVVDRIFKKTDPGRVAWISLGCFRHSPGFKEIIREVFPGQNLTTAEMFPGSDGKFRYLKKTRVAAYAAMLERIRSHSAVPFVYLCMENEFVWRDIFKVEYRSSEDLERAFSDHLKKKFKIE